MNARQKTVVRLGLAAMVVMALVPPWQVTRYHMPWEVQGDDGRQVTVTYQYRFVADPPEAGTLRVRAVAFGWSRLRYQYLLVALVVIAFLIAFRDRRGGDDRYGGDGSGHFTPDDPLLEPTARQPVLN